MKKALVVMTLCLLTLITKGQDPFVTQKFNNPVFTNPALAGNGEKLNRLSFFYRDQWRSVPVKYVSTFVNYDRKLLQKNNNKLGGGIQFVYDKAGDGSLSSFNPIISLSYTRYFNEQKQAFSTGVNVGYIQRTVDYSGLQFDNQFSGTTFDPTLSNGESLASSTSTANMSIGINFMTLIGKFSHLDIGFVVVNPHQPDDSFSDNPALDDAEDRPVRFNTYLTTELFVNEHWSFTPSFYFQGQEKAKEFHSSVFASYYTRNEKTPIKLSLGGGYRNDDAAFAYTGVKVKDAQLGFSYDINTSDFNDATAKKGGFELSLVYEFERKKIIDTPEIEIDTIWLTLIDSNEVEEEIIEEEIVEEVIEEIPEEVELIRRELPLKIFFDNDHPEPNTMQATTNKTYSETFTAYLAKKDRFVRVIGKEEADSWFNTVRASLEEFDTIGTYVKQLIDEGYNVKLTIKGYASPLASSQYNALLSQRRIQSVVNELRTLENGMLAPYLANGRVKIIENPFGETYAPASVNDDYNDAKRSIYSKEASYERRVEVIAIEAEKK